MKLALNFDFILLIIFFMVISYNSAQKEQNCNKNSLKKIDELLAKVTTYGNSGRKFPENFEELPKYCNESKVLADSIESLNKNCIKGLPNKFLTVSLFTVKAVIKQQCRKTSKLLPEYFGAAKCVNKAHNELAKCFTKSIDHLLGMQFAEEKERIPMACCEIPKLKTCIADVSEKVDTCDEKNIESTNRFIDSITGNSLNLLACGEFAEDSDKCVALKIPRKRKNQKRTKSLIMAFLHLFDSLPEVDVKNNK